MRKCIISKIIKNVCLFVCFFAHGYVLQEKYCNISTGRKSKYNIYETVLIFNSILIQYQFFVMKNIN